MILLTMRNQLKQQPSHRPHIQPFSCPPNPSNQPATDGMLYFNTTLYLHLQGFMQHLLQELLLLLLLR
jgi:hypothetical protein